MRRTHFPSVEATTIYLFFKYIERKIGWNKDIAEDKNKKDKKELLMSYVVILYKSGSIKNP